MKTNTDKDQKAAIFFNKFSIDFDTLYDYKRGAFMRWIDNKFRNGIYVRFLRTFEILNNLDGKTVLDIGCGSGPYIKESL